MQINGFISPQNLTPPSAGEGSSQRRAAAGESAGAASPSANVITNSPQSPPVQPVADLSKQQTVAPNQAVATQNRYQVYVTPRVEQLPPVPQKAVSTYLDNQTLGRASDSSGEYLGSIDLFV